MPNSALRWAAAAAIPLAAAGCSSGAGRNEAAAHQSASPTTIAATDGPGGSQQVTIDTTNQFRFDPPTVTAHTGPLKVTLVDTGSYPHNLSVGGLHFTSQTVSGSLGQSSTTFTLTFAKPGSYPFVCTFHSSAGMRGEFVIH